MTHKKLVVGNWKMNLNVAESSLLVNRLDQQLKSVPAGVEVVVCPAMLSLQPISRELNNKKFSLGAQNLYHKDEGAFTGEVSAAMLRDIVQYAIVGHSERRQIFGEVDSDIALKVTAALRHNITPILCVGETLTQRHAGETNRVIHDQLMADLMMLTAEDIQQVVVAYEPVWAISSGADYTNHPTPTPEDIEKAAKQIRRIIEQLHDKSAANMVRVLYGGSVSADTSGGILKVSGIDGLLVGGASLNYQQFANIIEAAGRASRG